MKKTDGKIKTKEFDNIKSLKAEVLSIPKRTLGLLEGKATVIFNDDFKITEDEFLFQSVV